LAPCLNSGQIRTPNPGATTKTLNYRHIEGPYDIVPDLAGWEALAHNYKQGERLTDFAHDPDRERVGDNQIPSTQKKPDPSIDGSGHIPMD
jgi:hypothetical protein